MPPARVLRVLETLLTMSFLFTQRTVYWRPILKSEPALGHNYISPQHVTAKNSRKRFHLVKKEYILSPVGQPEELGIWNSGMERDP